MRSDLDAAEREPRARDQKGGGRTDLVRVQDGSGDVLNLEVVEKVDRRMC